MSRKTPIPPPPARRLCLDCARWLPPSNAPAPPALGVGDCAHPADRIADLRHASEKDLALVVELAKRTHASRAAFQVVHLALETQVSFVRPSNVVSIDAARGRAPRSRASHGRESARPAS